MLKKRLLTALVGLPLVVVAVWFDEPLSWFTVLAVVWGILAILEFYRLVATFKVPLLTLFGVIWTALFILSPHVKYELTAPILFTSGVVVSLIWLVLRSQRDGAFAGWVWTMGGVLYLGWLLSYMVALRLEGGPGWVLFAIFTTFGSDTTAYFIGRALGKHPLAPHISPHKTWEGAAAGATGAVLVSLLFILPTPVQLPLVYWQAMVIGLLVSVLGQFGDLAKSILKRNVGVKESGDLLPGHGGVLDRTDSIVFAGVVVYYAFLILKSFG
jgi:phosphatidate cytidylyltransferase